MAKKIETVKIKKGHLVKTASGDEKILLPEDGRIFSAKNALKIKLPNKKDGNNKTSGYHDAFVEILNPNETKIVPGGYYLNTIRNCYVRVGKNNVEYPVENFTLIKDIVILVTKENKRFLYEPIRLNVNVIRTYYTDKNGIKRSTDMIVE